MNRTLLASAPLLCVCCIRSGRPIVATAPSIVAMPQPASEDVLIEPIASARDSEIVERIEEPLIPAARSLVPLLPSPAGERSGAKVVAVASAHLDPIFRAMLELQHEVDLMLQSEPDENAMSCRVWARQRGWVHYRLQLCPGTDRELEYRYLLDVGTEQERVVELQTAVVGRGIVVAGVNRGSVHYDLRFSSLASGAIELDFRIDGRSRVLQARLIDLPLGADGESFSSDIDYRITPNDGHLVLGSWLDQNQERQSGAIRIWWLSDGSGRGEMKSCRHLEPCALIRECWNQSGDVVFFGFANVLHPDLGWPGFQCAHVPMEASSIEGSRVMVGLSGAEPPASSKRKTAP